MLEEKKKYRDVKSYTNIWNVEMVLHALGDIKLPFAVTASQLVWFVCLFMAMLLLDDVPPLCYIESVLFKNVAIPILITWFVSKKTFDSKKPYSFLFAVIRYHLRHKKMKSNKQFKLKRKYVVDEEIIFIQTVRR